MPKKIARVKESSKATYLETRGMPSDDEEKVLDPDIVSADTLADEEEDELGLDDDELDPFKDRWEE